MSICLCVGELSHEQTCHAPLTRRPRTCSWRQLSAQLAVQWHGLAILSLSTNFSHTETDRENPFRTVASHEQAKVIFLFLSFFKNFAFYKKQIYSCGRHSQAKGVACGVWVGGCFLIKIDKSRNKIIYKQRKKVEKKMWIRQMLVDIQ